MNLFRIAFDIDDVLADFCPSLYKHYGEELVPHDHWAEDTRTAELIRTALKDGTWADESFWYNMSAMVLPQDLKVTPSCYITSSPASMIHVRAKWLQDMGFPKAPVIHSMNKGEDMKRLGLNILIDDSPKNIASAKEAGKTAIQFLPWYTTLETEDLSFWTFSDMEIKKQNGFFTGGKETKFLFRDAELLVGGVSVTVMKNVYKHENSYSRPCTAWQGHNG